MQWHGLSIAFPGSDWLNGLKPYAQEGVIQPHYTQIQAMTGN